MSCRVINCRLLITFSMIAMACSFNLITGPADEMTCGFTDHFRMFLKSNGYDKWDIQRHDIKCAAYGGKKDDLQKVTRYPVVFVHGNSDIGFGRGSEDDYLIWQTGFRELAKYLTSRGYQKRQLYTTTWGDANFFKASEHNHKKEYTLRVRAFIEAVLAYTRAPYINVISHSMGVTLARKVVKGGTGYDQNEGEYQIGPSLAGRINCFVGLAGGNLGLKTCQGVPDPACSNIDGFSPGNTPNEGPSYYFASTNNDPGREARRVYAIWSKYDDVIVNQGVVWGKYTSSIPGQDAEIVKESSEWDHFAIRDQTGPDLFDWLS